MKMTPVDYRRFRLSLINSPEFSHLWLLLYWPLYGLGFMYVERFYTVEHYQPMHCALDDAIPFNELFLIPYLFWFVFLIGMLAYTLFFEPESFRRMMYFIMLTYTVAIVTYFVFPNCQLLRPEEFERDNILTRFMARFYAFDTNTNVCPSIHVLGSFAVAFAAWDTERFSAPGWKWAFGLTALLISVSTLFVKQHSVIDVIAALLLCALCYVPCYKLGLLKRKVIVK